MRILIVNKFLHPNGGSETYIFKLGSQLTALGHQVQFFGMEHERRCVGNDVGAYTAVMDFHHASRLQKLSYSLRTIYSAEARRKIRRVLEAFAPDVVHLNNFNYQLTPSIILEIRKWERDMGCACKIVFTAHDYQLICPNHMLYNPAQNTCCEKCVAGAFVHCIQDKCIHHSLQKSMIGAMEGYFWKMRGVYRELDAVVCPTAFMKRKLDTNPIFASKTIAMLNFAEPAARVGEGKKDYALYFGRFSQEKGVKTLLAVARTLPHIQFVFAGTGPLENEMQGIPNIKNVGFQTGAVLGKLIEEARFSIYPSEWYENCPFSVIESQMYGTPVLGADIGGIPELIQPGSTGELFESGNVQALASAIERLWSDRERTDRFCINCATAHFDTLEQYCEKLIPIYQQ